MPEFLQDFYEDHPNVSKLISYFIVAAVAVCSTLFPMLNITGDLENEAIVEHNIRIDAEAQLDAKTVENADLIAALDEAQKLTDATLQTHLVAYAVFVEVVNDALDANTTEIENIWVWIEDFSETWADFQEQYEGDLAAVYSTMNSWRAYLYNLIQSIPVPTPDPVPDP